jgi:hypothetical protein
MCAIHFQSHMGFRGLPILYCKVALKTVGQKTLLAFCIEQFSDKYLQIWTLLHVSFEHILIGLNTLEGTQSL